MLSQYFHNKILSGMLLLVNIGEKKIIFFRNFESSF